MEERDWQGVALVNIGDIAIEPSLGIIVDEEANVFEFPAEDCQGSGKSLEVICPIGCDITYASTVAQRVREDSQNQINTY